MAKKVWLVERAKLHPRKVTMWHWVVDLGEGVFLTKADAILAATEEIGRFRVSRFELTRCSRSPSPKRGKRHAAK